jgi:PQQ-dependent catabolism-associated CXXCW motif protein
MWRTFLLMATMLFLAGAAAEPWQQVLLTQASYDDETLDYGIPPTAQIRTATYDAPTPTSVDGAQTITTPALRAMMLAADPPLLIDVLGGNLTTSLPGAVWLLGAGLGTDFDDQVQQKLTAHLAQRTNGDKAKPVVFFCLHRHCWLSLNATMRAVKLGYTNVYWYRGGRAAWQAAGLAMEPVHGVTF